MQTINRPGFLNKRMFINILLICGLIAFSVLSLISFNLPLIWIFLSWSLFFLFLVKWSILNLYRVIWFNIAVVLFLITVFELVFAIIEYKESKKPNPIKLERVYEVEKNEILGVTLKKNTTRLARKFYNGKLLYNAIITVDNNGLRICPTCQGKCDSSVLFFGDSFTFGEGVNDTETMPYLVGLALSKKYRVYNFGVHGYGPHQMLSAIEHGMVSSIVGKNVKYAIYQCIYPEHVRRMTNPRLWDEHGPEYKLGNDNQALYSGHFDDHIGTIDNLLQKSAIYRKIMAFNPPLFRKDKKLFIAVLTKSAHLLAEKFPGAELHIILWDWTEGKDNWVFDKFQKNGIFIHRIEDILPDRNKLNMIYRISPFEKHPNPYLYHIMARYVEKNIVRN
jgi:hypothetical protein